MLYSVILEVHTNFRKLICAFFFSSAADYFVPQPSEFDFLSNILIANGPFHTTSVPTTRDELCQKELAKGIEQSNRLSCYSLVLSFSIQPHKASWVQSRKQSGSETGYPNPPSGGEVPDFK